jgi:hypothetical protein
LKASRLIRERLDRVVLIAQALTVAHVEQRSAVFDLDDVICEYSVLRFCSAAPMAIDHSFTPTISSGYYLSAPHRELEGVVDRVFLLGWQASGARVSVAQAVRQGSQFRIAHARHSTVRETVLSQTHDLR